MAVTADAARRVGDALRLNWEVIPVETFRQGLSVELEHVSVTRGDLYLTGLIVLDHLRETPDYYARLAPVEAEAEQYWATHKKPSPTLPGAQGDAAWAFPGVWASGTRDPHPWRVYILLTLIIILAVFIIVAISIVLARVLGVAQTLPGRGLPLK